MRKSLFISFMLLVGSLSYAQIQKGDVLIGGSVLFSSAEINSEKNNFFNFTPRVGFLLSDRTSLGPILGYDRSIREQVPTRFTGEFNISIFTFGAFMRNYMPVRENLYFFIQSSVTYGIGNRDYTTTVSNEEGDQSRFEIMLSPGFSYFISDRLAVDVRLLTATYRDDTFDDLFGNEGEIQLSSFSLTGGLSSVGFGLSWFLK